MSAQQFVDPYQDPLSASGVNFKSNNWWSEGNTDPSYGSGFMGNPDFFGAKISDWLGFSNYKGQYDAALTRLNQEYERQSLNSARAWDEYMDSTATQRRVKDIEAAGLNPWLVLQSGGINASGGTTTASSGGSAKYAAKDSNKKSVLSSVAMFMLATAKLFTIL